MPAIEWAWVALGIFFVLQGVTATFIIRSIIRLRRTSHRIANHVQVISGQLEARGLVNFSASERGSRDDDDTPIRE